MFNEMMPMSIGGDSSKFQETKAVTGQNETITINTGLSSVKKFIAYQFLTSWTPNYVQVLMYDADHASDKYVGACIYPGSAYSNVNASLGTRAQTYTASLDISGGTVTIVTQNTDDRYAGKNLKWFWYAE